MKEAVVEHYTPEFEASCETVDNAAVVEVHSEIDLFVAPELAVRLAEAIATDRDVIVDLCDAPFLDSAGLREIIRAHAEVIRRRHRCIVTCAPAGPVERLLRVSGLTRAFEIANSRGAALAMLAGR